MSIKTGPDKLVGLEVIPAGTTKREIIKSKTSTSLSNDQDDPFFIADLGRLVHLQQLWTRTFPRIKPFYAVKCNDDPAVVSVMAALGTGFDCASKTEIKQMLGVGVSPDRIVFANPCKQISHIKFAARKGVSLMTFDNEMELHKVYDHYPSARLMVRIRADDPHAQCPLGTKFGCSVRDACDMLVKASQMGLRVVGVSFHVGSGCQTPGAYHEALQKACQVFQFAETLGYHFTILDIGGGFPGSQEQLSLFHKVATTINSSIASLFNQRDLEIIAEPGRYFGASPFTLAVQVTSKRVCAVGGSRDDAPPTTPTGSPSYMYYVNDGVYGSFNCVLYDHATVSPRLLESPPAGARVHPADIWGPTCDSMDKICEAVLPELFVGDWLVFEEMGAYTLSAHSGFNGFKRPHIYYYIHEEDQAEFEDSCLSVLTGRLPGPLAPTTAMVPQASNGPRPVLQGVEVACC